MITPWLHFKEKCMNMWTVEAHLVEVITVIKFVAHSYNHHLSSHICMLINQLIK